MAVPRRLPALLLLIAVMILMHSSALAQSAGYDRLGEDPYQSRSMVVATNGIVATSQMLAAQVGLDVLKSGGNAIDAAIATNAMLGLVEPMNCGVGGDLFVIYWDAKTKSLHGLNASGRSPQSLTMEIFQEKGLDSIPIEGPLNWSVPGCVDGWHLLLDRFGSRSLAELLEPSIQYADEGFPVTETISVEWIGSEGKLSKDPGSSKVYLNDGKAPREGEIFRNPALARTYRILADGGRDAFYTGEIAEQIVAYGMEHEAYLTMEDFRAHKSEWVDPVSTTYRGVELWELPPNGQGIAALQILNLLEPYDLAALGHNSPEHIHLFVEAKKLAFADRAKFYADPDFVDIPVEQLISKEYADERRKRIDPDKAATDVSAGDPILQEGDTIYLCVVDKEGNCCSFIQSLYYNFGSGMTPPDLGFSIQNRGALFALEEDHANRYEPGKRPFHTIIPAMATRDGKPWLVFGVMGGDMQPQGHSQIMMNILDFGMTVQQAGDAARVRHLGSQQPTGAPMESNGGQVTLESRIPESVRRALERKGHAITRSPGGYGGYQAIQIDPETGVLFGATDPRKDGAAVGY